jgi:hypothetical protein
LEKPDIRAHDLIDRYLEFQTLPPDKHDWNAIALADKPPRLIRYQRLVAILAALDIKTELASFDKGEFIDANDLATDRSSPERGWSFLSHWSATWSEVVPLFDLGLT